MANILYLVHCLPYRPGAMVYWPKADAVCWFTAHVPPARRKANLSGFDRHLAGIAVNRAGQAA